MGCKITSGELTPTHLGGGNLEKLKGRPFSRETRTKKISKSLETEDPFPELFCSPEHISDLTNINHLLQRVWCEHTEPSNDQCLHYGLTGNFRWPNCTCFAILCTFVTGQCFENKTEQNKTGFLCITLVVLELALYRPDWP